MSGDQLGTAHPETIYISCFCRKCFHLVTGLVFSKMVVVPADLNHRLGHLKYVNISLFWTGRCVPGCVYSH